MKSALEDRMEEKKTAGRYKRYLAALESQTCLMAENKRRK